MTGMWSAFRCSVFGGRCSVFGSVSDRTPNTDHRTPALSELDAFLARALITVIRGIVAPVLRVGSPGLRRRVDDGGKIGGLVGGDLLLTTRLALHLLDVTLDTLAA